MPEIQTQGVGLPGFLTRIAKKAGPKSCLYLGICQRRTVKNLKRGPENDPNAGNIAPVIYAGTLSAGQLSAGSSAGGTGWTPAFHRSLSR